MRSLGRLIWVSVFLLSITPLAVRAQGVGASGDVQGTVTDPEGAVVPGATVTLVDVAKGIQQSTTTGSDGRYRFTAVPPAQYDIRAEHGAFETQVRKGAVIALGQTAVVDFNLKISSRHEVVVVTDQPPLVDTQRIRQANTVGERYIRELPIDQRNYLSFTLLAPGVSDATTFAGKSDFRVIQTPESGLSFYGSNGRGNNITLDGGEANDDTGGVRPTISQDAVQEFQVNRSNYSAEFGGASGGVINIVSKSGTNDLHGSAYGFFRDDIFDARNNFAIAPPKLTPFSLGEQGTPVRPTSNRQQAGGTIGFPLRKDRTFLFAAYEHLRRNESSAVPVLTNSSIFAPTADQSLILGGLAKEGAAPVPCFGLPPNITFLTGSTCASILGRLLTVDPAAPGALPTEPYLVDLFSTNSGIFPFRARHDQFSVRLDHQINERNRLFVRYNFADATERNTNLGSLIGFSHGNLLDQIDSTVAAGWSRQFSPRLLNELRAQFDYNVFDVTPNDRLRPEMNIAGFGFFNRDIFLPSFTTRHRYEFADNLTLISGRHSLKLGSSVLLQGNHTSSHTFFPGRFSFGELPGFLLSPCLSAPQRCGLAVGVGASPLSALQSAKLGLPQFYQQGFGDPNVSSVLPFSAAYVQDSWAALPNLTLNFGVRYERDTRRRPLHTDKNNFAPRFGFSWDPFHDKKTVVRGGYGIFYSPIYYQIDDVVQSLGLVNGSRQIAQVFAPLTLNAPCPPLGVSAPGFPLSACIFQTLFAQGVIGCSSTTGEACVTPASLAQFGINITHTGPVPPLSVLFSGSRDYANPYSQQASFGIEREFAPDLSLSVDYIFVRTLKIPHARDKNLLPAPIGQLGVPDYRLCPPFGCFVNPLLLQDNVYESTGRAFYNGLLVTLNRRFGRHFSLLADYTFSKAIDEVTDFNSDFAANDELNLRAERGLSNFDERHKLVLAGVLESPFRGGSGASPLARILSGFSLSPLVRANSGHPFNLLVGADINHDRHPNTDRPPLAGRNTGRGPDFVTFDLRVARRFVLGEDRSLELTVESFDLLNRLNFASVNDTVGIIGPPFNLTGRKDRTPSQPLGFTSAFDPRRIQLGLRFNF